MVSRKEQSSRRLTPTAELLERIKEQLPSSVLTIINSPFERLSNMQEAADCFYYALLQHSGSPELTETWRMFSRKLEEEGSLNNPAVAFASILTFDMLDRQTRLAARERLLGNEPDLKGIRHVAIERTARRLSLTEPEMIDETSLKEHEEAAERARELKEKLGLAFATRPEDAEGLKRQVGLMDTLLKLRDTNLFSEWKKHGSDAMKH